MSYSDKIEFLQRVPLFQGIESDLIETLSSIINLEHFTAGQFLCHKGDSAKACYIIGHGQVNVMTQSEHGEQLCSLGPGHVIGEVALLDGRPRSASVQATGDVTTFVLGREDFSKLVAAENKACMRLLDNIAKALAVRIRVVNDQYIKMFSLPGQTVEKLNSQMRTIQSTVAGANQATGNTSELAKRFKDIAKGLPSSS